MEKLKIAICEDDPGDLAVIQGLIGDYDREMGMDVRVFTDGESLLAESVWHPDVVLMDIQLPTSDGFLVAKQLRSAENPPVVIFTTHSTAYTRMGYGVALRYLCKPLVAEELFEALDAAAEEATSGRLVLGADDAALVLRTREILYIESFGHYTEIYTQKGSFRIRKTMKEILSRLPRRSFFVPHKSYVVNGAYIQTVTGTEIILESGTKIPVSRGKAAEFKEGFYCYLGR